LEGAARLLADGLPVRVGKQAQQLRCLFVQHRVRLRDPTTTADGAATAVST